MRTQVGIVGAGPAGLVLSHMLHLEGIDSVVIERADREHVRNRLRAGVLEHGTVDMLTELGLGERIAKVGLRQHSIGFRFNGESRRINFTEATGRGVWVYPQHEVVTDLMAAREKAGAQILFGAPMTGVTRLESRRPAIQFQRDGKEESLECDFVAGCDGFRGPCREAIPAQRLKVYDRRYPFGWLGIHANAAPAADVVTWAGHEDGFAGLMLRTPTVTRLYLQCDPDDDPDNWTDDRIWSELHRRLDVPGHPPVNEGLITQKGVTPMRSFMVEPMQYGRLFLAGDAAHIVPPTGAKGLNAAMADVKVLAAALVAHYKRNTSQWLDRYSDTCLRRMWLVQRFASGLCSMFHQFPEDSALARRLKRADLDYTTGTAAGRLQFSENFTGLPIEA